MGISTPNSTGRQHERVEALLVPGFSHPRRRASEKLFPSYRHEETPGIEFRIATPDVGALFGCEEIGRIMDHISGLERSLPCFSRRRAVDCAAPRLSTTRLCSSRDLRNIQASVGAERERGFARNDNGPQVDG